MKKKLFAVVVAVASMFAVPQTAQAEVTKCMGALPAGVYQNVVVPTPADCAITWPTLILGNVHVERGASLTMFETPPFQTRVEENIVSNHGRYVRLLGGVSVGENVHILGATEGFSGCDTGPFIGGNLIFEAMVGLDTIAHACGCHIRGSLHVFNGSELFVDIDGTIVEQQLLIYNNAAELFLVALNRVFHDLHFYGNTGPSVIATNTVGNALLCHNNTPPPFAGGNVAARTDCPSEPLPF
jgi:hypothetical protein